jgi:hypothetical protein
MWVVFLSFLVGMVLRIADPEPDNAEKLYERLRARSKQHSHWLLLAALVLGLGALCFIYAPITGPLFKFGVLAWDVLTSLPAFGFGALIAYMTTDFILRHRNTDKAMIPGFMLGAGAIALFVATIFPADQLKNILQSISTPVATLNFASVQTPSITGRPTLIMEQKSRRNDTANSDNATGASNTIYRIEDRLGGFKKLANFISGNKFNYKESGHINELEEILFKKIIKPIGACGLKVRSASDNEDPEYIISHNFTEKLRDMLLYSYQKKYTDDGRINTNYLTEAPIINMNLLRDALYKLEFRYKSFVLSGRIKTNTDFESEYKCLNLSKILDDPLTEQIAYLYLEHNSRAIIWSDSVSNTAYLPIVVSSILSINNLRRDAVDELKFWAYHSRSLVDKSYPRNIDRKYANTDNLRMEWDAYRRLSIIYTLTLIGTYNNFNDNPASEISAQREAISSIEEFAEKYEIIDDIFENIFIEDDSFFLSDGACSIGNTVSGISNNIHQLLSLFIKIYAININNLVYYTTIKPEITLLDEISVIKNKYIDMLKQFDYDCLSNGDKEASREMALYFSDTYTNAKFAELQSIYDSGGKLIVTARKTACELGLIRENIQSLLNDHLASSPLHTYTHKTAPTFADAYSIEEEDRSHAEQTDAGKRVVAHIDRLIANVAGISQSEAVFSDLGFRRAYKRACAD